MVGKVLSILKILHDRSIRTTIPSFPWQKLCCNTMTLEV